jgi:hypothetical protein
MERTKNFQLNMIFVENSLRAAPPMPAKKTNLTDAERAKRIRETAREIGTDNDPESLERAFKKVVRQKVDRGANVRSRPRATQDKTIEIHIGD